MFPRTFNIAERSSAAESNFCKETENLFPVYSFVENFIAWIGIFQK